MHNQMVRFLKRMNRGIALAAILLVGLTFFLFLDSAGFAKEEEILKEFLEEYLVECGKINLLPEEYRGVDIVPPDDVLAAKEKEFAEFVDKYFIEYKGSRYASTKSDMLQNGKNMYRFNRDMEYAIENCEYSLVSIDGMKKQATNAVRIVFSANLKISASRGANFVNIANFSSADYLNGGENESGIEDVSLGFSYTLMLFKEGGKWKIASTDGYYMSSGQRVVITQ